MACCAQSGTLSRCTCDVASAVRGETVFAAGIEVFTLLFIVHQADLCDGLRTEMRHQHHALPLQRAVLPVQLQRESWETGSDQTTPNVWRNTIMAQSSKWSHMWMDVVSLWSTCRFFHSVCSFSTFQTQLSWLENIIFLTLGYMSVCLSLQ